MTIYEVTVCIGAFIEVHKFAKTRERAEECLQELEMCKVFENAGALATAYEDVIDRVVEDKKTHASRELNVSASIRAVEVLE